MITEKYTRGVSAVESILVLDRLRQSVAVKELETTRGNQMGANQLSMRKTASVPNFSQVIYLDVSIVLVFFLHITAKKFVSFCPKYIG